MAAPQLTQPTLRTFTRAEYDRLVALGFFRGERLELMHGRLLRMPPIGPPHATAVTRLAELLLPALLGRATVRIQQPFCAHDDSEPEPDIAVVPRGDYSAGHPDRALLVVEVAESSLAYDRDTKRALYAASNVSEYWVVDLASRTVEIFTDPRDDAYAGSRVLAAGERITPGAFPDVAVAVDDVLSPTA
jgi:Uma2 family endonuclease